MPTLAIWRFLKQRHLRDHILTFVHPSSSHIENCTEFFSVSNANAVLRQTCTGTDPGTDTNYESQRNHNIIFNVVQWHSQGWALGELDCQSLKITSTTYYEQAVDLVMIVSTKTRKSLTNILSMTMKCKNPYHNPEKEPLEIETSGSVCRVRP